MLPFRALHKLLKARIRFPTLDVGVCAIAVKYNAVEIASFRLDSRRARLCLVCIESAKPPLRADALGLARSASSEAVGPLVY